MKLQYFAHLMWKADSVERPWCWERLKTKEEESGRGWDGLVAIPDSMDMNLGKLWEIVSDMDAWSATVYGVTKSWTWLGHWTTMVAKMAPKFIHNFMQGTYEHIILYGKRDLANVIDVMDLKTEKYPAWQSTRNELVSGFIHRKQYRPTDRPWFSAFQNTKQGASWVTLYLDFWLQELNKGAYFKLLILWQFIKAMTKYCHSILKNTLYIH